MDEFAIDVPDNLCFGCSPHNEHGLQMRFRRIASGRVESHYTVPEHLRGAPGVVHGGIQAVLLDETMGVAIHEIDGVDDFSAVTIEFNLRYRRPAPTTSALIVCGDVVRREGRGFWVEGAILDEERNRLTEANARWRRIDPAARAARAR